MNDCDAKITENIQCKAYAGRQKTVDAWLDVAQALLLAGEGINNIESSLNRLVSEGKLRRISTFTIPSTINVTCEFPDGEIITQTRRVITNSTLNFEKIEKLNSLWECCCTEEITVDEIRKRLDEILHDRQRTWLYYIGGMLAASAFTLFFGGSFADAAAAAASGVAVCFFNRKVAGYFKNAVVYSFLTAAVTGTLIAHVCKYFPIFSLDKVLIGEIMLLIPGISITNSMRDMLVGDLISGILRFTQALLTAGALALGFMIALIINGQAVI